jgi:hypothetical protein
MLLWMTTGRVTATVMAMQTPGPMAMVTGYLSHM